MGRKIQGKKRNSIRDPYEQQRKKEEKIKYQYENPPERFDFQEQPRRMRELLMKNVATEEDLKRKRGGKRKKKNSELIDTSIYDSTKEQNMPGMNKYVRPAPVFKQRQGEPEYKFLARVNRECDALVRQTKFEVKFGVEIHEDPETGKIELVKAKKDEVDEMWEKQKPKRKKILEEKEKKKETQKEIDKAKRKQMGSKRKKKRKKEHEVDFEPLKDEVKFGEVVHCPPQLSSRPRKAGEIESRPGRKPLLLKSLMVGTDEQKQSPLLNRPLLQKHKKVPKVQLSVGQKRQLEAERQSVINAYRLLKAQRYNNVK